MDGLMTLGHGIWHYEWNLLHDVADMHTFPLHATSYLYNTVSPQTTQAAVITFTIIDGRYVCSVATTSAPGRDAVLFSDLGHITPPLACLNVLNRRTWFPI